MINKETLKKLTEIYSEDKEMLDMIYTALQSFSEYHSAIYKMETYMKIYSAKSVDGDEYRNTISEMDKKRTVCHNAVLVSVNMLNRLAAKENLPLIYEGTVSENQPYRREVADAILRYEEEIIKERI